MKLNYFSRGRQLIAVLAATFTGLGMHAHSVPVSEIPTPKQQKMLQQQPLLFIENLGQVKNHKGVTADDILFTARNAGAQLYITATGIHYQFTRAEKQKQHINADNFKRTIPKTETHRFTVSLQGSNPHPQVITEKQSVYTESYINAGSNVSGARSYEQVTLKNVYEGIDWVLYNKNGFLEYDFIVRPGADVSQIKMKVTDADNVNINKNGSLTIKTRLGEVTEKTPVSFDDTGKVLATAFRKNNDGSLGFTVADAAKGKMLRIDPEVVWATYYGSTGYDVAEACAVDLNGNVYLRGGTASTSGIAAGGYQSTPGNMGLPGFVVKFNSAGQRLWATYTDGTSALFSQIAVDTAGSVYITGETGEYWDFNATTHQTVYGGGSLDAYLIKINANGTLGWKTYYGGNGDEYGKSCSVDANGNIYLTGYTNSSDNIATSGAFKTSLTPDENGAWDAYLVKFSNAGSRLWGTYIGGNSWDMAESCTVDAAGNIYIAGSTLSTGGIAYNGFKNTITNGLPDGFLIKFNSAGQRQWGTYYGGSSSENVFACTTDLGGNVYIAGYTESWSDIAFNGHQNNGGLGSIGNVYAGGDGYLVKFKPNGSREWATYYGTNEYDDWAMACRADLQGNIYLSGFSQTPTEDPLLPSKAFVIKYSNAGKYIWDENYQGNGSSSGYGMAVSTSGHVYICGSTSSTTGLATGGFQNTFSGDRDAFLIKIDGSGSYNCSEPRSLAVNVTSSAEAAMSWAAPATGTPQGYEYAVSQSDEAPQSGIETTSTAINQVSLSTGQYYLYVRAICGPERYSEWAVLQFCAVPAPAGFSPEFCAGTTVGDLQAQIANLSWYTQAEGGTALAPSQTIAMGTYYVSQTIDGCESARTAIAVTVIPVKTYYEDADADYYGNSNVTTTACIKPAGYTETPGDCDDADAAIQLCPGAVYTKINADFCNTTVAAMTTIIYADAVPGVSAYRFRISTLPDNSMVIEKNTRWFRFSEVSGISFGTNYTVEVAVFANDAWQPYGESCKITTPAFPSTQISTQYCETTVISFNSMVYADGVPMASGYRFRVNDGASTSVITKSVRYFKINEIPGYTYNKTYTIDVAALINGTWGQYGNACNITTMAVPGSQLESAYCGITVSSFSSLVYASAVPLATQYLFRITSGSTTVVVSKPVRYLAINEIPDYTYSRAYTISVAVQVNGEYGSFGPSCTISTPAATTTQLATGYCGATMENVKSIVYASHISLAARYRFRIVDGGNTYFIENTARYFALYNVPGSTYSKTYTVDVAVQIGGVWGPYGPACTVSTPNQSTSRPGSGTANQEFEVDNATQAITLISYPNPFTENFTIEMNTQSLAKVTIRAFDMNGRLVEDITTLPEELVTQKLGSRYASGVYNVIVSQGDYMKAFKIVKK
jgi:hypothetical protein